MFLIILALICALTISGVAIFYSVIGLGAIFAAAKIPIYIMGGTLEVAKLVTASWLYQNWKNIPFLIKTYLTIAVGVLMIITSLGIFGFLSKAHVEQATPAAEITAKIDRLEEQILREESTIDNLTGKIDRLQSGSKTDGVGAEIDREQKIIDNADNKIKADVELIQTQIANTQKQIDDIQAGVDKKIELARTDSKETIAREQNKLDALDQAVSDVLNANKSFFNEEKEAAKLKDSQGPERAQISKNITDLESQLTQTIKDIQAQADAQINELRAKIDGFNAEISVLQASVAEEVALAKQRINEINESAIQDSDQAEVLIAGYEQQINDAYDAIDELKAEQFIEESKIRELTAEVGPIKYIAQFFAGEGEVDLERAVTWLIITIMFVFDPLAVLLLIAVNMSLKARYGWSFEGKGALESKKKTEPQLTAHSTNPNKVVIDKSLIKYYHDTIDRASKRMKDNNINVTQPSNITKIEQRLFGKTHKGDE